MRLAAMAGLAIAFAAAAFAATGIVLPPPPAGFKILNDGSAFAAMRAAGVADRVAAEKPNDNWPKGCIVDPRIQFVTSWSAVGSQQNIEIIAKTPEDPATDIAGTRSEPAGKKRYRGGVLTWRKDTVLAVQTACKSVTLYNGTWVAFVGGKMVSVGVSRLYGSKEAGQGWIDSYIDKVSAAVTRPH